MKHVHPIFWLLGIATPPCLLLWHLGLTPTTLIAAALYAMLFVVLCMCVTTIVHLHILNELVSEFAKTYIASKGVKFGIAK